MTDYDVMRWTVLVYLTWKGCGIGWKLAAQLLERWRTWYVEAARRDEEARVTFRPARW